MDRRLHWYVKNHNLGFLIPYTISDDQRNYMLDFVARLDDGHGRNDLLNLIVAVSGQKDGKIGRDKAAKVPTGEGTCGYTSNWESIKALVRWSVPGGFEYQ